MDNLNQVYDEKFFADIGSGSRLSAQTIIPFVLELTSARSVIDVGCGTGEWLSVFQELGVSDILGVDGDHVSLDRIKIDPQSFKARDLSRSFEIGRTFDLAISVEVAEHLPPSSADLFVENLTRLSSVVLFSAAIPHQDGVHHINEQWPSYWVEKFANYGFGVIDILRFKFWAHDRVAWWYKQNLLIFVKLAELEKFPQLKKTYSKDAIPPDVVHPDLLLHHVQKTKPKIVRYALRIDSLFRRTLKKYE